MLEIPSENATVHPTPPRVRFAARKLFNCLEKRTMRWRRHAWSANRTASKYTACIYKDNSDMFADVHMDVDNIYNIIYIYIDRPIIYCITVYLHNRRKFRSQISDNMDRWKSRGGKSQRGEEQKREDQRKSEKKEDAGRETLCFFPCWSSMGSST